MNFTPMPLRCKATASSWLSEFKQNEGQSIVPKLLICWELIVISKKFHLKLCACYSAGYRVIQFVLQLHGKAQCLFSMETDNVISLIMVKMIADKTKQIICARQINHNEIYGSLQ